MRGSTSAGYCQNCSCFWTVRRATCESAPNRRVTGDLCNAAEADSFRSAAEPPRATSPCPCRALGGASHNGGTESDSQVFEQCAGGLQALAFTLIGRAHCLDRGRVRNLHVEWQCFFSGYADRGACGRRRTRRFPCRPVSSRRAVWSFHLLEHEPSRLP